MARRRRSPPTASTYSTTRSIEPDILEHAYALARENDGAPGVDGMTFEQIEAAGSERVAGGLREDLVSKTYRPQPVRRVMIPKPGGGERPLGIPTIRDRVVQTAAKLVLEPIFEADLEDSAYGYRPKRSALDAVKTTAPADLPGLCGCRRRRSVQILRHDPASRAHAIVARRIVDRHVLHLIKMWLRRRSRSGTTKGKRRMKGGKSDRRGTPQGGVISPLLANLYMNRFLKHWRLRGCGEAFHAHVVNYADDFVILSRGHAAEALAWTRAAMTRLGLTLNEAKTSLKDARTEGFDFLGYTLGPKFAPEGGQKYLGASPSKKSVQRDQGQDRRSAEAGREGPVAGSARQTEPPAGGLVGLLQLRNPRARPTEPSIVMSASAFAASSPNGTRSPDEGPARFPGSEIHGEFGVAQLLQTLEPAAVGLP